MKYLVILALLVCSCTNKYREPGTEIIENSNYIEAKPLEYKGHSYLLFRSLDGKGFGGATHNPDCKCIKK